MNLLRFAEKATKKLSDQKSVVENLAEVEKFYNKHVAPRVESAKQKCLNSVGLKTRQQILAERDFSKLPKFDLMVALKQQEASNRIPTPVPKKKPIKPKEKPNNTQNFLSQKSHGININFVDIRKSFVPSFPKIDGDWKGQHVLFYDIMREAKKRQEIARAAAAIKAITAKIHQGDAARRKKRIQQLGL